MPTIHLLITGEVQGVFYRATAKEIAEQIGLTGWVKNREDGSVEAMAVGTEEQLQRFIEWCKIGPSKAVVTNVTLTQVADEHFTAFTIKR